MCGRRTELAIAQMITSIEQTNDQPWTVEEDEKLLKMLRRCPDKNKWSIVSKGVGTRTATECRERYYYIRGQEEHA